jgi:hypothetical protein
VRDRGLPQLLFVEALSALMRMLAHRITSPDVAAIEKERV